MRGGGGGRVGKLCTGVWLRLRRAAVCTCEIWRRDPPLLCTWHLLYLCQAPRCPLPLPGLARLARERCHRAVTNAAAFSGFSGWREGEEKML